jgi:Cu+-exporting ATPase
VLPAEKGNAIKDLQKDGKRIMMIGDGINDSPALTLSDIGVGINSGSDIAMDSSDVILMNNDLTKVVDLINTGSRTVRNIKQNLFWAFFYNCLMIPIAIGLLSPLGITINPMIASIAMTLSSLTVILNALRLKR